MKHKKGQKENEELLTTNHHMSQPTPNKDQKDWTQASLDDLVSDLEDAKDTMNVKIMEKVCWSV